MLSSALTFVILTFLAALLATVLFKLLSGGIRTRGLLTDKETGEFSPARLQLLGATVVGAALYAAQLPAASGGLPPVPDVLLVVVGGSNLTYLGAKIYSRFIGPHSGT